MLKLYVISIFSIIGQCNKRNVSSYSLEASSKFLEHNRLLCRVHPSLFAKLALYQPICTSNNSSEELFEVQKEESLIFLNSKHNNKN